MPNHYIEKFLRPFTKRSSQVDEQEVPGDEFPDVPDFVVDESEESADTDQRVEQMRIYREFLINTPKKLQGYLETVKETDEREELAKKMLIDVFQDQQALRILVKNTNLFISILEKHFAKKNMSVSYPIRDGENGKQDIVDFWGGVESWTRGATLSRLLVEVLAINEFSDWFFNNTHQTLYPILEWENPPPPKFVKDFKKELWNEKPEIVPIEAVQSKVLGLSMSNDKPCILFTGQTGVGKSAQMRQFVYHSINNRYHYLTNFPVFYVDLNLLFENIETRGSLEAKMNQLIHFAEKTMGFFVVDEIHSLLNYSDRNGSSNELSPREMLKTAIDKGKIKLIAATNMAREVQNIDPAIIRRFHIVEVTDPNEDELVEITRVIFSKKGIKLSDQALEKTLIREIRKPWSDQNLSLVVKIQKIAERLPHGYTLNQTNLIDILRSMSISQIEHLNIDKFWKALASLIIGQEGAKQSVIDHLKALKVSRKEKGPLAIFTFLGPTGVGKSFTGETIGRLIFENPNTLKSPVLRIDCNAYKESTSVAKLFGAGPGYIGYGNTTPFEAIKQKPDSVVIFEEFEKMHRDAVDSLLQILQEGKATLGNGEEIDFSQAIIVITSNALQVDSKSINMTEAHRILNQKFPQVFKPEMIGRLSAGMVIFDNLNADDFKKILEIELNKIQKDLQDNLSVKTEFSINLKNFLLHKFLTSDQYNKKLGARELCNKLMIEFKASLADKINIFREAELVQCDLGQNGELIIYEIKEDWQNNYAKAIRQIITSNCQQHQLRLMAPNQLVLDEFFIHLSKKYPEPKKLSEAIVASLKALEKAFSLLKNKPGKMYKLSINQTNLSWEVTGYEESYQLIAKEFADLETILKKDHHIFLVIDRNSIYRLISDGLESDNLNQFLLDSFAKIKTYILENLTKFDRKNHYSLSLNSKEWQLSKK